MAERPSDLAIEVAALSMVPWYVGVGWFYADELRGRLALLGFTVNTQQVAAWLRRMCREDTPRFEAEDHFGMRRYRLSQWGRNEICNKLPGIRPNETKP